MLASIGYNESALFVASNGPFIRGWKIGRIPYGRGARGIRGGDTSWISPKRFFSKIPNPKVWLHKQGERGTCGVGIFAGRKVPDLEYVDDMMPLNEHSGDDLSVVWATI